MESLETVVHGPTGFIEENGEKDGQVYEIRYEYLKKMVTKWLPPGRHGFLFDTSVTWKELNQSLQSCPECRITQPILLSTVCDNRSATLKCQIHIPFMDNAITPSFYSLDLAKDLLPFVTGGFVVFDEQSLQDCSDYMLSKFSKVRVKNGCGCAGQEQQVITQGKKIDQRILRDISCCGFVLEKNIEGNNKIYSFSSFMLPDKELISIGIITETENDMDENVYKGTTCVIFDPDTPNLPDFNFTDPLFGNIALTSEEIALVRNVGVKVAKIYRGHFRKDFLPRVNMDIMWDGEEGRYVFIDASLRVGGNTWCEFRGGQRIKDGEEYAVQSIRMLETKEEYEKYEGHDVHLICSEPYVFGLDL